MPRSAYGFSKLAGEVCVRAAHDEHGLPYTICRPFNAYGPGEMPEDEPGHRAHGPRRHPKCLALPEGAPLPIFGAGEQTRTLTHVDDIADGVVTAMASPRGAATRTSTSRAGERDDGGRDRARHLGGVRPRPGAPSRSSTCRRFEVDVHAPLAERREGPAAAGLGGADRRARGRRADGRVAAAARRRA